MFDNIAKFFKKFVKNKEADSKDTAKERLHLVLMQDRANVSADFLELMKQEIIDVIKKYIDVDETSIDVKLTNKTNGDGTTGAPILYANIPIISIKDENKNKVVSKDNKDEKQEENDKKEKDAKNVEKDVKENKEITKEELSKEEKKQSKEENEQDKKEDNKKVIEDDKKIQEETKKEKTQQNTEKKENNKKENTTNNQKSKRQKAQQKAKK